MTDAKDAEKAMLSAVMSPIGDGLIDFTLDPADCYEPRHEEILRACVALHQQNRPVDAITVADYLGKRLSYVGGQAYLHELVGIGTIAGSATHYAGIVAEAAMRRRLKQAAAWIEQQADDAPPDDVRDQALGMLGRLSSADVAIRSVGDTIQGTLAALEADEETRFTPTGWVDLNRLIGGWHPGHLYVVGARPGVGKSIIGAQAALDVARIGKSSAVASMEMSTDELNHRLIAQEAEVNLSAMVKRKPTDDEWKRIAKAVPTLVEVPMFVDDRASQTIAMIRAHARSVSRRADLGLVVIDYLQQVTPPRHLTKSNRQEVVADTSRQLKLMARELNVPVIGLAQLNRAGEYRSDKRPTMSDLRESGAIEADADVVMLLHRESPDDPTLHVGIPKNRHGEQSAITLAWQGQYARAMSAAGWNPSWGAAS